MRSRSPAGVRAAEGLTDQQIAGTLGVSHFTVRTHMDHIRTTLGATNRTQAVVTAVTLGILTVETDQMPTEPPQPTGHDPDPKAARSGRI